MKLNQITLIFNYTDRNEKERIIKADISPDGWNQWGAEKEILGKNVNLIEIINQAVQENIDWNGEEL